ncbi:hypothetical protein DdX_21904 [Ditylenchus destructor]|uniref:Uncharacterized protein n=1 Tax=Ditylenchus destructor TaxID=166010 RepID=A0AAD4MGJ6_9BILA|nr:hypothetical protein DdX_21904 [Ditylenchus destructor]
MAPNVQHLRLSEETLNDDFLQELAKIVPGLKSLDLTIPRRFDENTSPDYAVGLIECFKAMKDLEYLSIYHNHRYDKGILFNLYSFVQFPPNLKYLDLTRVSNAAQILSWVAEECRHLKGLSLSWGVKENTLQAISQLKSLTYLEMRKITVPCDIGYVLEALSELRALSMSNLDEKMISEIAQHCKKLEYLRIDKVSPETHGSLMRLATLPNLCSLDIWSDNYPKEQTTELINRLIANGKIQYIRMATAKKDSLEPDVLFEVLRRCKNIQSIGLEFGRINRDLYSKICQVVDEIDEEQRQQRELPGMTHPIVEVECNSGLSEFVPYEYKWLKFTYGGGIWKMSLNKWKYGSLSAGKP